MLLQEAEELQNRGRQGPLLVRGEIQKHGMKGMSQTPFVQAAFADDHSSRAPYFRKTSLTVRVWVKVLLSSHGMLFTFILALSIQGSKSVSSDVCFSLDNK